MTTSSNPMRHGADNGVDMQVGHTNGGTCLVIPDQTRHLGRAGISRGLMCVESRNSPCWIYSHQHQHQQTNNRNQRPGMPWKRLETGDCGSVSSFNAPLRIRLARFQGTPSSTPSRRGPPSHGAHKKRPRAACELKAGTPVIPCPPIRRPPPFATTLNCRQIIIRPPS